MRKFGEQSGYLHQQCYNHALHLGVCDVLYKDRSTTSMTYADENSDDSEDSGEDSNAGETNVFCSGRRNFLLNETVF